MTTLVVAATATATATRRSTAFIKNKLSSSSLFVRRSCCSLSSRQNNIWRKNNMMVSTIQIVTPNNSRRQLSTTSDSSSSTSSSSSSSTSNTATIIKPWSVNFLESNGDYASDASYIEEKYYKNKPLYKYQDTLPSLPIPTIQETITKFIPTALPLATSNEEKQTLLDVCNKFPLQANILQERLLKHKEHTDKLNTSWLQLWWNTLGYLQVRTPNVIFVSYFFILNDDKTIQTKTTKTIDQEVTTNKQQEIIAIKRGASVLHGVAKYRTLICSGMKEQETLGKKKKIPLCSVGFKYLFHSCRIPRLKQDTYKIYDPYKYKHAIVVCNGHYYKINILDINNEQPLSIQVIEKQLKQCIDMSKSKKKSSSSAQEKETDETSSLELGWLTTNDRDTWANNYNELLRIGGTSMKDAMETLESGALLLCLDIEDKYNSNDSNDNDNNNDNFIEPYTIQDCSRHYWYGTPYNRYYDKSIQLIITGSGKLGLIGEHSMMDGMPVIGLCDYIVNHSSYEYCLNESHLQEKEEEEDEIHHNVIDIFENTFNKLSITNKEYIQQMIIKSKNKFNDLITKYKINVENFTLYGSIYIKKSGYSPDAYVQVAMQLASYRLHNGKHIVGTYESTQVRPYKHGRTETTRSVNIDSEKFVKYMGIHCNKYENNPIIRQEKLDLFTNAVQAHRTFSIEASKGLGIDRHFLGLELSMKDNDDDDNNIPVPELFQHPLYERSKKWQLSTSTTPYLPGFGPVVDDGLGIGYLIENDCIKFTISCCKKKKKSSLSEENINNTDADKFQQLLNESLIEISSLIDNTTETTTTPPKSKL